jgi:lactose/L-arabinose transport system substrate-binding protein
MADVSSSVNASSIGGAGWYVLKNVGHEELAVDFLAKTFGSDVDMIYQLVDDISLIPTLTAASDYSQGDDFFGGQNVVSDLIDWTSEVPTVNYGQDTYAIEDIMTEALQEILNGADVNDTLSKYQETIEAAVAQ